MDSELSLRDTSILILTSDISLSKTTTTSNNSTTTPLLSSVMGACAHKSTNELASNSSINNNDNNDSFYLRLDESRCENHNVSNQKSNDSGIDNRDDNYSKLANNQTDDRIKDNNNNDNDNDNDNFEDNDVYLNEKMKEYEERNKKENEKTCLKEQQNKLDDNEADVNNPHGYTYFNNNQDDENNLNLFLLDQNENNLNQINQSENMLTNRPADIDNGFMEADDREEVSSQILELNTNLTFMSSADNNINNDNEQSSTENILNNGCSLESGDRDLINCAQYANQSNQEDDQIEDPIDCQIMNEIVVEVTTTQSNNEYEEVLIDESPNENLTTENNTSKEQEIDIIKELIDNLVDSVDKQTTTIEAPKPSISKITIQKIPKILNSSPVENPISPDMLDNMNLINTNELNKKNECSNQKILQPYSNQSRKVVTKKTKAHKSNRTKTISELLESKSLYDTESNQAPSLEETDFIIENPFTQTSPLGQETDKTKNRKRSISSIKEQKSIVKKQRKRSIENDETNSNVSKTSSQITAGTSKSDNHKYRIKKKKTVTYVQEIVTCYYREILDSNNNVISTEVLKENSTRDVKSTYQKDKIVKEFKQSKPKSIEKDKKNADISDFFNNELSSSSSENEVFGSTTENEEIIKTVNAKVDTKNMPNFSVSNLNKKTIGDNNTQSNNKKNDKNNLNTKVRKSRRTLFTNRYTNKNVKDENDDEDDDDEEQENIPESENSFLKKQNIQDLVLRNRNVSKNKSNQRNSFKYVTISNKESQQQLQQQQEQQKQNRNQVFSFSSLRFKLTPGERKKDLLQLQQLTDSANRSSESNMEINYQDENNNIETATYDIASDTPTATTTTTTLTGDSNSNKEKIDDKQIDNYIINFTVDYLEQPNILESLIDDNANEQVNQKLSVDSTAKSKSTTNRECRVNVEKLDESVFNQYYSKYLMETEVLKSSEQNEYKKKNQVENTKKTKKKLKESTNITKDKRSLDLSSPVRPKFAVNDKIFSQKPNTKDGKFYPSYISSIRRVFLNSELNKSNVNNLNPNYLYECKYYDKNEDKYLKVEQENFICLDDENTEEDKLDNFLTDEQIIYYDDLEPSDQIFVYNAKHSKYIESVFTNYSNEVDESEDEVVKMFMYKVKNGSRIKKTAKFQTIAIAYEDVKKILARKMGITKSSLMDKSKMPLSAKLNTIQDDDSESDIEIIKSENKRKPRSSIKISSIQERKKLQDLVLTVKKTSRKNPSNKLNDKEIDLNFDNDDDEIINMTKSSTNELNDPDPKNHLLWNRKSNSSFTSNDSICLTTCRAANPPLNEFVINTRSAQYQQNMLSKEKHAKKSSKKEEPIIFIETRSNNPIEITNDFRNDKKQK